MQEDSIFTKIINGEIPSHKIYEDDSTFAFLDIHPVQEGHVLVVPKKQVEFIWDLPTEDYQALMQSVHRIGKQLKNVLSTPYVGVQVIGVDVPHAHIHLIPFSSADQLRREPDMNEDPDHASLAVIAKKIAF